MASIYEMQEEIQRLRTEVAAHAKGGGIPAVVSEEVAKMNAIITDLKASLESKDKALDEAASEIYELKEKNTATHLAMDKVVADFNKLNAECDSLKIEINSLKEKLEAALKLPAAPEKVN